MDQSDGLPVSESAPPPVSTKSPDDSGLLALWGAAPVLAAFSPTLYRRVARHSVLSAIGYLVIVGTVLSIVQSIVVFTNLSEVSREIPGIFERGEIPEITITDGVAEVSGPQPFVVLDQNGQLFVIDTTGVYTTIDRSRYYQGIILTRTDIVVLNQAQLQTVPLTEFQAMVNQNPLVINGDTLTTFWNGFSAIFGIASLLSLIVWHTLVRLTYIVMLGLLMWGVAAIVKRGTGFNVVLIAGIFASIPPLLIRWLFKSVGFQFPGFYTLMFVPLWGLALAFVLMDRTPTDPPRTGFDGWLRAERSLRGWRVWIALPLLIYVLLEGFFNWNLWYVDWALALVTAGALLIVSLLPLLLEQQTPSPG